MMIGVMGVHVSILGCLFHWKQAICRKFVKMKFADEMIAQSMRPDMLEVLTLIPHQVLATIGFVYIHHRCNMTAMVAPDLRVFSIFSANLDEEIFSQGLEYQQDC